MKESFEEMPVLYLHGSLHSKLKETGPLTQYLPLPEWRYRKLSWEIASNRILRLTATPISQCLSVIRFSGSFGLPVTERLVRRSGWWVVGRTHFKFSAMTKTTAMVVNRLCWVGAESIVKDLTSQSAENQTLAFVVLQHFVILCASSAHRWAHFA